MKRIIINLTAGLLFTIFFLSFALNIVLFFRPFYYAQISTLKIVETSGFTREVIIENYDSLIDYCSPFYKGPLTFSSFPSSKEAQIHFEEVKQIFVLIFWSGIISLIVLIPLTFYKWKKADAKYFLTGSILSVFLPLIAGIMCAIDFNRTFVIFHKLLFRNDYWLFSADTDPVILILPEQFFMNCAVAIAGIVILFSVLLFLIYHKKKRHFITPFKLTK